MAKLFSRFAILITISLIGCCNQSPDYNPSITQDELHAHIDFLASDSLRGRKAGTPFERVAAKYIKDYMEYSGLEMLGSNGYQFFDFIQEVKHGHSNSVSFGGRSITHGKDFVVYPFSSNDTLSAEVVFVGYGLKYETDSLVWNDYKYVDVAGKWILAFRGTPNLKPLRSLASNLSTDKQKALVAKEEGAAGIIFVSPKMLSSSDDLIYANQKQFSIGMPAIHIKRTIANQILYSKNTTIDALEQSIEHTKKPNSFPTNLKLQAQTDISRTRRTSQNVVALIEGTDPALKHQYILIGAHYDHIGLGGPESTSRMADTTAVHNGADDNASGIAALLEIGQKLNYHKPKRSIILVAFGAEEVGLVGSQYFRSNPLVPLDSISVMINLDMIGRLNEQKLLKVGGVRSSLEAESIVTSLNLDWDYNLQFNPEGYGPSDHAVFYSQGIPVLFFSTGPHADYHTPFDIIDRINFEGLEQNAKFIHQITNHVANTPYRLTFRQSSPRNSAELLAMGEMGILGILPDVNGKYSTGVRVNKVYEGSPAYTAGITANDTIFAINGKDVKTLQCYFLSTQKLEAGMTVSIEFKRDQQDSILLVQL